MPTQWRQGEERHLTANSHCATLHARGRVVLPIGSNARRDPTRASVEPRHETEEGLVAREAFLCLFSRIGVDIAGLGVQR